MIVNIHEVTARFFRRRGVGNPITAAANHVTGVNLAAAITGPASASEVGGRAYVVAGIAWSYSGPPTGGRLTITDNAVIVFDLDVTAGGPGVVVFDPPIRTADNKAMVITLTAGGVGITGKLNANYWQSE